MWNKIPSEVRNLPSLNVFKTLLHGKDYLNTLTHCNSYHYNISFFSIYTLSDLGDLSNLIGSLSRTIQQYSPPSEWIMCELSVFPIF